MKHLEEILFACLGVLKTVYRFIIGFLIIIEVYRTIVLFVGADVLMHWLIEYGRLVIRFDL